MSDEFSFDEAPLAGSLSALPSTIFGDIFVEDLVQPEAPSQQPDTLERDLASVVLEIEAYQSSRGWDMPLAVFALVPTARLLEESPETSDEDRAKIEATLAASPGHLSAVEQTAIPASMSLEDILGHMAWPQDVQGAAIAAERTTLPSSVMDGAPEDPQELLSYLQNHPEAQQVRMVVGAVREGATWCAMRLRSKDSEENVIQGAELIPTLAEHVKATLDPIPPEDNQ
ncbi:MAG: PPA1309 family protein [Actinomycetaceae bacterium]|nr:PPA1309 family protein [Actinomycetaceae bacterium]